jgi:hypothetical protein
VSKAGGNITKGMHTRCRGAVVSAHDGFVHGGRTCSFSFDIWTRAAASTARDKREKPRPRSEVHLDRVIVVRTGYRVARWGVSHRRGQISSAVSCSGRPHSPSFQHAARYLGVRRPTASSMHLVGYGIFVQEHGQCFEGTKGF